MTQVNLLPWREEAKQARKMRFLAMVVAVVILAFIAIIVVDLYYRKLIDHQEERNNFLTTQLEKEQGQLNMLNAKKREILALDSSLHFIMSLREQSYRTVALLDTLARITPEAVSFNKIERQGNSIIITGKAKSDSQITLLMNNIANAKIFKQPDLSQITAKESSAGDERLFQLKVELKDKLE